MLIGVLIAVQLFIRLECLPCYQRFLDGPSVSESGKAMMRHLFYDSFHQVSYGEKKQSEKKKAVREPAKSGQQQEGSCQRQYEEFLRKRRLLPEEVREEEGSRLKKKAVDKKKTSPKKRGSAEWLKNSMKPFAERAATPNTQSF